MSEGFAHYDRDRERAARVGRTGCNRALPSVPGEVIAKCGDLLTWHWAHRVAECDPWSEGETQWHIDWKERFPVESREIVMGEHRADVLINNTVIEFQRSPISPTEIHGRETFYTQRGHRLVWVFAGDDFEERFRVGEYVMPPGSSFGNREATWKRPRRSVMECNEAVIFDVPVFEWRAGYRDRVTGVRHLFLVENFYEEDGFDRLTLPDTTMVHAEGIYVPLDALMGGWTSLEPWTWDENGKRPIGHTRALEAPVVAEVKRAEAWNVWDRLAWRKRWQQEQAAKAEALLRTDPPDKERSQATSFQVPCLARPGAPSCGHIPRSLDAAHTDDTTWLANWSPTPRS